MLTKGGFIGVVLAHLVATTGCYEPKLRDCTVHCAQPSDCTGGQICRSDGWCAMPNVTACPSGESTLDADPMTDEAASTPDAVDLCPQGCTNGTCVAGVCVIDCGATSSCNEDVLCPANLPCRVVCGDHACAHHIVCGLATSCEVQCSGAYSCQDEIQCNANRCDVECTGLSSCKRRTKCASSCACDVSCVGVGSCAEASECPALTCKLGNGCSAQLSGCNRC